MSDEINYKNNPLHGVSLKNMLNELVAYYGFDILFAYLNLNCFKTNPSVDSSVKFLKKTDWAREKVEDFYLYKFKSLPKPSSEQFKLAPRDRIIPDGQAPADPAELSLEDAERMHERRARKSAGYNSGSGKNYAARGDGDRPNRRPGGDMRKSSKPSGGSVDRGSDPWAKWKAK
jgi:uncharacterized protein (DUF2132 family)